VTVLKNILIIHGRLPPMGVGKGLLGTLSVLAGSNHFVRSFTLLEIVVGNTTCDSDVVWHGSQSELLEHIKEMIALVDDCIGVTIVASHIMMRTSPSCIYCKVQIQECDHVN
jgi:hypothetical protein